MIKVGLDHTLFLQIIQFLLVVFLTNKFILKPIKGTMDAREAKINGLLESAENQIKAVEESKLGYEAKLRVIRSEIAEYQRKVKEETSARVEKTISKAKEEINISSEKSRAELGKAVAEARSSLKKDVKDLSDMMYKTISESAA